MAQPYKRSLLVALVALAPAFTACEQVDSISGVTESPAPVVTTQAKPKFAELVARLSGGTVPTQVAWEYVTPRRKGRLQIGQHVLEIPKGAVSRGTYFRMAVADNGYVAVQLDAWDNRGQPVDTFHQHLKLTLPFDETDLALHADDLPNLFFANTENDRILEVVGVSVDRDRHVVTGQISHFSMWALAKEISMGID